MKKNQQFNLLLVSFIILVISSRLKCVSFMGDYFLTYKLKGYYFLILVMGFTLYGAYIKNKIVKIITYLLSFMGYVFSFYTLISNYNKAFKYELGVFVFILSFVLFIISAFISNDAEKVGEDNVKEDVRKEQDNDNFLIANIILGFKEIPYNSVVLLGFSQDDHLILSYILNNQEFRLNFNYDSILKIEYEPVSALEEVSTRNYSDDNYKANLLLTTFLLGGNPFVNQLAISSLENTNYQYKKTNIKTTYNIKILVMYNGEEKEIVLNSVNNPNDFIERIKIRML